ncbi:bifunctional riboflavin kinase/FAD synthetase [Streptococcus sp. DD13]|uniref:bifunctional riboflavin kinase/FAD synthetase n=1 Tax=Streptococcus sp. DD13 TaxID=1777881 RepID=UPI000794856D|nr:bifunctional riboflavin kinase/FAD synthetase [Streptococcus sp. DD13]KXT78650.1 Riboflavin kinase / FMN adenylyltransferase [Streptococcus sp. DD13]
MKIHYITNEKDIQEEEPTILVLGYFDGLHIGHQALFDRARSHAKERDRKVVVLTYPHSPKLTFERFRPELLLHLTDPQERQDLFASYGVDHLYLLDFTSSFASLSPEAFVEQYIQALNPETIIVGFDYHFGRGRADVRRLQDLFDGQVIVIDEVQMDGEKVSSSRIRDLVQKGDVKEANRLLGHTFSTEGLVVHGDARGRTIGFPTANLANFEQVHLPADGVYVTEVAIDGKRYRAMTSIGFNETFGGTELRLESHIFHYQEEIYGKRIRVYWLDKIREMEKFDGMESLMRQLQEDQAISLDWKA